MLVAEMAPAMQEEEMLAVAMAEVILRAATAVEETILTISGALLAVAKRRRRKRRTLGEFCLLGGLAQPYYHAFRGTVLMPLQGGV